jgi:hypothetical protein
VYKYTCKNNTAVKMFSYVPSFLGMSTISLNIFLMFIHKSHSSFLFYFCNFCTLEPFFSILLKIWRKWNILFININTVVLKCHLLLQFKFYLNIFSFNAPVIIYSLLLHHNFCRILKAKFLKKIHVSFLHLNSPTKM